MDYEYLLVEEFDNYCVLTMNRPEKKNALNKKMRAEFLDFLARSNGEYHAVILTGVDDAFTSGLDLSEARGLDSTMDMWSIANNIYDSETLFIAAVNGHARGGGMTLTNACDFAITHPGVTFGIPEIGFGVYATIAGPTTQLVAPKKLVSQMVLTGKPISAEMAERAFLVNQVVEPDQLMVEAHNLARELTKLERAALAASKKGLNTLPFDESMREQGKMLTIALNGQIRESMNKG